ncbi:MAG: hypothetical protein MR904_04205 [Clostridia bacterium]|nr:hypothetical protein [Clostridia bacterium]
MKKLYNKKAFLKLYKKYVRCVSINHLFFVYNFDYFRKRQEYSESINNFFCTGDFSFR